ncbi:ABC transporter ATP-binding protein [Agaribacterium haliotis]|uniref:ABC transporter ATP-binding protein n=1 Tax=Agaribacterium haliotis TaxID=2013869 RepID=UPI000BB54DFD|nr:ABC transporter ATP-binding protein [Agaribacterium haliotis]
MSAIQCRKLLKQFVQGEQLVRGLDEVDLEVEAGEFVCLSGPSGSGKTTLLNALGGLDSLDAGQVQVAGQQVEQLSKNQRAKLRLTNIGFVFQAYNLIPVLSALENVEFVMQLQGRSKQERREKALAVLAEVGLQGLEARRPSQLSGGQQQRVAVARAIASEPDLVLADEPTANLDSASASQLIDLFLQLNAKHGLTFVIATHDQRVMQRCRRLITMQDGKIIADVRQDAAA